MVPSAKAPRLLIPVGPGAGAALARYPAALPLGRAAARALMASWFRVGGAAGTAERLEVRGNSEGIDTYLAEILGSPIVVSLGIGTNRINRKPVIGIFTPRGVPLGYAKVGGAPYAANLVVREARALDELSSHEFATFGHPRLIHTGTWHDNEVLVSTFMATSWWRAGRKKGVPEHIEAELADRFGQGQMPLAESPLWVRVRRSAEHLAHDRFLVAIEQVERRWGGDVVKTTAWHGDLTPWNVGWTSGRTVNIWDWERFEIGVPSGLDRLHWVVQAETPGSPEIRWRKLAQRSDYPTPTRAAYLAALAERFLEGGDAGHARADSLLDALDLLWVQETQV